MLVFLGLLLTVVERFMYIEKNAPEELINDLCDGKVVTDESGKKRKLTIDGVYNKTKTKKVREETIANLESIENQEVKAIEGVYDVVVIDPPWDIKKIERDVAPNQVGLDYPTMSFDSICELPVSQIADENAVLFLWVTTPLLLKPSA